MQRFFCPSANITKEKIVIADKDKVHHLKNVLRLKMQDEAVIFDEKGNEYKAKIEELSTRNITMIIKERCPAQAQKKFKITVAPALPKGSRMDDIIDKLTQLGVDRIVPLLTERVIIKLDKNKSQLRKRRWQKIAQAASQQSQRNSIPIIDAIKDIRDVLREAPGFDLRLIPTLLGSRGSLKEILSGMRPKNILVLIGPEGDFTEEEVDLAKRAGFIPVTLGNLVLRVETAAIAITSFIGLYADH